MKKLTSMTLPEVLEATKEGLPPKSVREIAKVCRCWSRLMGDVKLRDVTEATIAAFEQAMVDVGLGDGTIGEGTTKIRYLIQRVRSPHEVREPLRKQYVTPTEVDKAGTLRSYYHVQYERRVLAGKSAGVKRLYRAAIDRLAKFLGREGTIHDLNDDLLNDLVAWHQEHGRTVRTGNRVAECLKALWNWLAKRRIVDEWPTFRPWPTVERTPVAFMPEEMKRLMETIRAEAGEIGRAPAALFWECLISLLFDSAERISAIMALQWSDLDPDSRWLTIRGEYRKGARRDNSIRLHPETVAMLMRLREFSTGTTILEWPYARTYLWRRWTGVLRRAKLPTDRAHKFHIVRKTVGSMAEAAGLDATRLLTHSRRSITERYLDPRLVQRQQVSDHLPRPDALVIGGAP